MTRRSRAAHLLAPVAAAASALTLTGCAAFSPQTTSELYVPSDGGQYVADNGVGVYNALLLTSGRGTPGALSARIVNDSAEDVTVRMVTAPDQASTDEAPTQLSAEIDVPARQSVRIGPESDVQVPVEQVTQRGGQVLQVAVDPGNGEVGRLDVFVIGGVLDEYADLVPGGETTAP